MTSEGTSVVLKRSEELRTRAAAMGITLSDRQLEQFLLYYDILIRTNEKINLTAITEWDAVLEKHFLDSMASAELFPAGVTGLRMIDVGTGAGLPGVPLKILFPDLQVTLMDTLKKRVGFLQEVIQTLELDGITAIQARAEDLGRDLGKDSV